ncbi:hypothetical protein TIFTF001_053914 [Ficus carica]|uniref:Uncharacterized protein n=1 Tax=Ficus carica TaxID=3494 RepID=A0AA88EJD7_FICCA|nr:hypothetical protein TIFTF001_053914 [Ficus carica]
MPRRTPPSGFILLLHRRRLRGVPASAVKLLRGGSSRPPPPVLRASSPSIAVRRLYSPDPRSFDTLRITTLAHLNFNNNIEREKKKKQSNDSDKATGEDAEWSGGLEAASTRRRTLGYGGE